MFCMCVRVCLLYIVLLSDQSQIFWRGYSPAIVRALVVNGSVFLAFEVAKDLMTKQSAGLGV